MAECSESGERLEEGEEEEEQISVTAKLSSGKSVTETVEKQLTVLELKAVFSSGIGCAADCQTVLFNGRICRDSETLAELGLSDGDTVIIVKAKRRIASPLPVSSSTPLAEGSSATGDGSSVLCSAMSSMFDASPAMRKMVKDNPSLGHALKDPSVMRQALKAASDPQYYNEMMRSNDRALANIESLPGGHSALRRMYSQIQEPMEDAMDDLHRRHKGKCKTKLTTVDKSKGFTVTPMPNPSRALPTAAPFPGAFGGPAPAGWWPPRAPMMRSAAAMPPMAVPMSDATWVSPPTATVPIVDQRPAEERFADEITQIEQLGLAADHSLIVEALVATDGCLVEAIDFIDAIVTVETESETTHTETPKESDEKECD